VKLIGATTENPSFKLTGALLSRCRQVSWTPLVSPPISSITLCSVFVFERLQDSDIEQILLMPYLVHLKIALLRKRIYPRNLALHNLNNLKSQRATSRIIMPQLTRQVLLSIVSLSAGRCSYSTISPRNCSIITIRYGRIQTDSYLRHLFRRPSMFWR